MEIQHPSDNEGKVHKLCQPISESKRYLRKNIVHFLHIQNSYCQTCNLCPGKQIKKIPYFELKINHFI